jgi:hypothetical protein
VDALTARQVLRISPDSPLTPELVERAFAGESAARHPSLYPDPAARAQAEAWVATLQQARAALHAELGAYPAAAPAPRRRLPGWAIASIVVGVVVLLALITVGTLGAVRLVGEAGESASRALESEITGEEADEGSGAADPGVERMEADETFFAFPAALEFYADGRYLDECPAEFEQGCWQSALFTEADCESLQVELGYTDDADAVSPDTTETIEKRGVVAGQPTVVVFGNDDYGYGWINQVTCLDTTG